MTILLYVLAAFGAAILGGLLLLLVVSSGFRALFFVLLFGKNGKGLM